MGYLSYEGYDDSNGDMLTLVRRECARQESLRKAGKFSKTPATPGCSDYAALAMLTEEVGEVARELCEDATKPVEGQMRLFTELTQVAAIAVAWMERLSREMATVPGGAK